MPKAGKKCKEARRRRAEDYAAKTAEQQTEGEVVMAALTEAWMPYYDDLFVVEQEVELMQRRGHCSYAVLKAGVESNNFDGVSNFAAMPMYVDVASKAVQIIDGNPCNAAVVHELKESRQAVAGPIQDTKPRCEKPKTDTAKDGKLKSARPHTGAAKCGTQEGERVQARGHGNLHVHETKACVDGMWALASDKAKAELQDEFVFDKLCNQGKKLYKMVLADKTKRLYEKLKARARYKAKKAS